MIKTEIPTHITQILKLLHQHDAEAFLVGGCVRDMLMCRIPHDYDITSSALPNEMIQWFQEANYHVLPTGIKHGTITVFIEHEAVEITTYRRETTYKNHRVPEEVIFSTSLYEDLKRRDFTMNAIAYDPHLGYIDPYGGIQDIQASCVRCVGDPMERFHEDALRILRALRFSATLKFSIDPTTWIAIQTLAHDLRYISQERKRDELNRLLLGEKKYTLQFLRDANILCELFPAYDSIYDHPQPTKWHSYDIFQHTDVALNHTVGFPLASKLAIVLHDIGKPNCESFDSDGTVHYKGHAHVSMLKAERYLKDLHYDHVTITKVCTLIQYHDYYVTPNRSILRKFLTKFNNEIPFALEALNVQIADNFGKNPIYGSTWNDNIYQCIALILTMEQEKDILSMKDLCLNGIDLLNLGYQGKEIGITLRYLLDIILQDPTQNTQEQLVQHLKNKKHMDLK